MKLFLNTHRNLVFLSIMIIAIIICFSTYVMASNQNEVFENDFYEYQYGLQLINEGNFVEAQNILTGLIERKPESPTLEWYTGLSYAMQGDLETAIIHYEEALRIRPFLLREPQFMVQYGEILFRNGDVDKAKVYLEESLNLALTEDHRAGVTSVLEEIAAAQNNNTEEVEVNE